MKIILWGINYAPESTGIAPFNADLCEYLTGCGHQVAAVTAFPYYPQWRKRPADRKRWFATEKVRGVRVHRCGCYVPRVVTTVRRIVHELSFCLSSAWRILRLPRADIYLVVSPPLALGFFAWMAAKAKRSRFVLHVQDLQPDAAAGLGMLPRGGLIPALYRLERFAYAKAAVVSGISDGMISAFRAKGVPAEKRALLPNWLRVWTEAGRPDRSRAEARRHFDIDEHAMLAVYAGNLGRKQHLEIMVAAARLLAAEPAAGGHSVRMIIAGDGAARPELEATLRAHPGLAVQLLPLLSNADYHALLVAADVAVITQATGTGQFFFPSKLLSVLAAGLPVIAVADENSELADAVRKGCFGFTVAPGDAAALAGILRDLGESRDQLEAWTVGTGWVQRFSRATILPQFEAMLGRAARGESAEVAPKPEEIVAA